MLEAFVYGFLGMSGVLVAYIVYDGIFTFAQWLHNRKIASQSRKRRRH